MTVTGQREKPDQEGGKARLLEAAQQLVQERPFDEVTIEEIIKRARLSRPAFYYHFAGGKEELRAALVERGIVQDAPAQDVRQEVLKAALRVYARSGISAATLEDIAAEAGVTKSTLSWHFHSKEDLLAALIKQFSPHSYLEAAVRQIRQDLEAGVPLDDETVFRRLVEAAYDAFEQQGDPARLAILLLHTHPDFAQLLADKIVTGRRSIVEYIQKRQDEGCFRPEIIPGFLVHMMATLFAMRVIGRGLYSKALIIELPREVMVEQLVSLLLYGIVRREVSEQEQE